MFLADPLINFPGEIVRNRINYSPPLNAYMYGSKCNNIMYVHVLRRGQLKLGPIITCVPSF